MKTKHFIYFFILAVILCGSVISCKNSSKRNSEISDEEALSIIEQHGYNDGYEWAWGISMGPCSKSAQKEAATTYFQMYLGTPQNDFQRSVFTDVYLPAFYAGCKNGWEGN